MNIKELKEKLKSINPNWDVEMNHVRADELLLEYINDPEVTQLFDNIEKWYV